VSSSLALLLFTKIKLAAKYGYEGYRIASLVKQVGLQGSVGLLEKKTRVTRVMKRGAVAFLRLFRKVSYSNDGCMFLE
jgi:hypothetical protein